MDPGIQTLQRLMLLLDVSAKVRMSAEVRAPICLHLGSISALC